jgi:hypothetical protein
MEDFNVYMDASGRKYLAQLPSAPGDSKLPVCTFELREILRIAGKPLSDAEIEACQVAIATTVYPENDSTQGDSNVA